VSAVLGNQVAAVIQQLGTVEGISQDQPLLAAVARITANLDTALDATTILNQTDKVLLRQAGAQVAEAVRADDKAGATARLEFLQRELTTPGRKGFAVWNADPWRLLEDACRSSGYHAAPGPGGRAAPIPGQPEDQRGGQ